MPSSPHRDLSVSPPALRTRMLPRPPRHAKKSHSHTHAHAKRCVTVSGHIMFPCTASQYSHGLPERVQWGGFREHRENVHDPLPVILWGKRLQCVPLPARTVPCHHSVRIAISVGACTILDTSWRPGGCPTLNSTAGRSLSPGRSLDPSARPEPFAPPWPGGQRSDLSGSYVTLATRILSRPSRHEKPIRTHAHAACCVSTA